MAITAHVQFSNCLQLTVSVSHLYKKKKETHMLFTVFLFIRLINSFGIDQQSLACSQRSYSVLLTALIIAIRGYAKDWMVTGTFLC